MSNNLQRLTALVGNNQSKTVATVTAVNADGTCKVQLNSGVAITVFGEGYVVSDKVYIEAGSVLAKAADLPFVEIDI